MSNVWDWIHSSVLGQPDANVEARQFLDQKAAENAAAVNPNAPPPNAPPPMGAAQPGPGEPASQQTPKSWGSLLLDLQQQQQSEQQFSRSLGGMLSTLAQPRNQEAVRHSFDTQQMDPLAFGKTAMDLGVQQQGLDRTNQIAKIVNDPVQGPALAAKMGIDWGLLKTGILTDPGMIGKAAQVLATPTEMQRNLAAAQAAIEKQVRLEHPDWTDAQVQAEVNRQAPPSMLLSGVGPPEDQAYRRYAADETAAGRTPMDPVTWKTHNETVTKEKDAAVQEYPKIDQKLSENETIVKRLLAKPDATLAALQAWLPTTGKGSNIPYIGSSQDVKDAARDLQTLQASLKGEGLAGFKNVRNQMEFSTLGTAATGALDPNNDKATLILGLQHLLDKFGTTRSIARQQAGMPVEEAPVAAPVAAPTAASSSPPPKRRKYNEKGELID